MIDITLPDNSVRQYPVGVTGVEIAKSISDGLARNVLSIQVNDDIWDATRSIATNSRIKLLTWSDPEGKATMWHSSAHLMAEAIELLYPGVKFGIGPDIENGFYYDIDFGNYTISSDDFPKIEKKILELAKQKQNFIRKDVAKTDAINYFVTKGDEYKVELLQGLDDGQITFYESGKIHGFVQGAAYS